GAESEKLVFASGDNTWDLARTYSGQLRRGSIIEPLKILVYVGDRGFNYQNNLEWMKHLDSLGIKHERLIVPGAEHSARQIYEASGLQIMRFHAQNFGLMH
ncbi:MAG: 1,4-beta-xylanase, partial [Planctomycetaceae bacterium]